MDKILLALCRLNFYWIFFVLAGKEKDYNISDELEFQPNLTEVCGLSCLRECEKNYHKLIKREMLLAP